MGYNRYKVTFECDSGCDYGSCGKRNLFIFEYNRSCDIGNLFFKHHADDSESKMELLATLTDNAITALINVLTREDPIEIPDLEEQSEMKKARDW